MSDNPVRIPGCYMTIERVGLASLGAAVHIVFSIGMSASLTSVKLSYELGKISTGKPKLITGEVSTFQGFWYT